MKNKKFAFQVIKEAANMNSAKRQHIKCINCSSCCRYVLCKYGKKAEKSQGCRYLINKGNDKYLCDILDNPMEYFKEPGDYMLVTFELGLGWGCKMFTNKEERDDYIKENG